MKGRIRDFVKRHSMVVGFVMGSVTAGTVSGLYALHLTVRRLQNILDPSVTTLQKQAQYIYVEDLCFDYPDKPPWEDRQWDSKESIPFWSHWIEKRTKGLSWRLLEIISTSEDEQEKIRTVKILKSQKNLKDSDFQHLAQLCNSKTAAFLAREPHIDTRFFLTPPKRKECYDKNCLLDKFHDLFVELKKKSNHWCLRYFVSKMFRHSNWFRELEYFVFEFVTSPLEINNENAVKMCVESLLHHVMIKDNIHAMVEARGLEVLLDACRLVPDSFELKLMAVKILLKVSSEQKYLRDIHMTGWLRVLVEWSYECDQRLSAPAASALVNLDRSRECDGRCYKSEVCLLYPLHREDKIPDVDVIIVHGLLGSVHSTWKQRNWDIPSNLGLSGIVANEMDDGIPETYCALSSPRHLSETGDHYDFEDEYEFVLADIPESESETVLTDVYSVPCSSAQTNTTNCGCCLKSQCWPKDWLPKDYSRVKILGVDYFSRITDWTNWCPFRHTEEMSKLSERSRAILEQLIDCGVGERPIVWVGHSMGGLIIKHMLTQAMDQNSKEHQRLLKNSKHVFFLSTPHLGSPVASIRKYLAPLLPSVETRELELNSPGLIKLHDKFCNVVKRLNVRVVSFLETKGTKLSVPPLELEFDCVAPTPSDIGTGVVYGIPVGHVDIAKLSTPMSFIYFKILEAIKQAGDPNSPGSENILDENQVVSDSSDKSSSSSDGENPSNTENSASAPCTIESLENTIKHGDLITEDSNSGEHHNKENMNLENRQQKPDDEKQCGSSNFDEKCRENSEMPTVVSESADPVGETQHYDNFKSR